MPCSLLLFDLDGTLVDSQRDLTTSVNAVRGSFHLAPLRGETISAYIGNGVQTLIDSSTPELTQADRVIATQRFYAYYYEHMLDTTAVYPGIRELLGHFTGTKAVVTNKPERFARHILEGLSISTFFDLVIGGDTLTSKKPAPDQIHHAMNVLHESLLGTILVGDGINDILSAHAAGIRCVFVGSGYGNPAVLLPLKPDYYAPSHADLHDIILTA